jgi:hypothetical protein
VDVQVLVRMKMVCVQVLVDFDLAAQQTNNDGESGEYEQAASANIKTFLPALGKEFATEVAQNSGYSDDDGMSAGESNGEPYDASKVIFDRDPKGGNSGEMIGAESVDESSDEDSEQ